MPPQGHSDVQRRCRETRAALRRVHPANNPSDEDVAKFHELHALHEEEDGRYKSAAVALERARRTREVHRSKRKI
jgi:hypothetical protein